MFQFVCFIQCFQFIQFNSSNRDFWWQRCNPAIRKLKGKTKLSSLRRLGSGQIFWPASQETFTPKLRPRPLPHEKAPDPMEDAILPAAFPPTLQQVMPTACPVQGQDRKVYGFSSTGGMFGRTGSWVGCSLDPPCRGQQKSTARLLGKRERNGSEPSQR